VVGVGWVKPRAAMREPDTTTVFTASSASGAAGVAGAAAGAAAGASACACWAWACIDRMPQALATARLIIVR
jgi:hypothetical protein